jgi:hypothetical protein
MDAPLQTLIKVSATVVATTTLGAKEDGAEGKVPSWEDIS